MRRSVRQGAERRAATVRDVAIVALPGRCWREAKPGLQGVHDVREVIGAARVASCPRSALHWTSEGSRNDTTDHGQIRSDQIRSPHLWLLGYELVQEGGQRVVPERVPVVHDGRAGQQRAGHCGHAGVHVRRQQRQLPPARALGKAVLRVTVGGKALGGGRGGAGVRTGESEHRWRWQAGLGGLAERGRGSWSKGTPRRAAAAPNRLGSGAANTASHTVSEPTPAPARLNPKPSQPPHRFSES